MRTDHACRRSRSSSKDDDYEIEWADVQSDYYRNHFVGKRTDAAAGGDRYVRWAAPSLHRLSRRCAVRAEQCT